MLNYGGQQSVDRGSAAYPGYTFNGLATTGMYGRPDGGFGHAVFGKEVARFEGTGRKFSREIEYNIAQRGMTGGGILSYIASVAKWTNRLIMIPASKNIFPNGYFEITVPAAGTVIPVFGGGSRTVTADGIPVAGWDALYAVAAADGTCSFIVGTNVNGMVMSDNYILVYAHNADFDYIRFATGEVLYNNSSFYNKGGWVRSGTAGFNLRYDDGSLGLQYSASGEYRDLAIGYSINFRTTNSGTNEKRWRWNFNSNAMSLECVTDAYDNASTAISFVRSGITVTDIQTCGSLYSVYNGIFGLGKDANRWRDLFLVNQPNVSSDRRYKTDIRDLTEDEIEAWSAVRPKVYRVLEGAEIRAGYVAQDVENAFGALKLDAFAYGLISRSEEGFLSLVYGECMIFEAAYQRQRADRLESEVARLNRRVEGIVTALNLGGV